MALVLVDTDVFSFFFKRDTRRVPYVPMIQGHRPCLSFMSVAELKRWAILRQWGPRRVDSLSAAMQRYVLLPYDDAMADCWAEISAERTKSGTPIACGDCWIAATAVRHGLQFVTHNRADFRGISGLRLLGEPDGE